MFVPYGKGSRSKSQTNSHISAAQLAQLFRSVSSGNTSANRTCVKHNGPACEYLETGKVVSVTKLRLYNAFVISVLHGAETWTLLKSEEQKLEAFNMSCQRRILGIRWYDFVTNATITNRSGQESVRDKITRRRHAMFGHVRRLPEVTAAHMALHLAVKARTGHRPTTGRSETSTWPASPSVDATTGSRHRTRR